MTKSELARQQYLQMKNLPLCIDAGAEILTQAGWKQADTITTSDYLLTKNITTNQNSFNQPTSVTTASYTGSMIRFEGPTLTFSVTPNHRVLLRDTTGSYSFTTAQELYEAYLNSASFDEGIPKNEDDVEPMWFDDYKLEAYVGTLNKIVCVQTPDETFYARVSGSTFWTGNSTHQDLKPLL